MSFVTRSASDRARMGKADWNDLRSFLAVAENGSLTGAGHSLGLSQPSIGRRIKSLELAMQARLLSRSGQRYALTCAGEQVYHHARSMRDAADEMERKVAGLDSSIAGAVCIATTECLAAAWLVRQLVSLGRRHRGIQVEISVGLGMARLHDREADLALRVGTVGDEGLESTRVARTSFGLYASRRYLQSHGEPQSLESLRRHRVIDSLLELGDVPQARLLKAHIRQNRVALSTNSIVAQLQLVRGGGGIAALPRYLVADAPDLVQVLTRDFAVQRDLFLVQHRDLVPTARFKAVRSFLVRALKRDQHRVFE
ncbi:MAG: LysR family transcriptional regulator [Gammaproteobacteria bacterium]|nr:LysR family transcriptional regulator [Gammaproteobacteria bacterium]